MMTFIAVCMGLLVLELGIILGAVVYLVMRVGKTAEAVEVVAYRVDDKIAGIGGGWVRALQGAAGLVSGFWGSRSRD